MWIIPCSWFLSHFCGPRGQNGAFIVIVRRCLTKATEGRVCVGSHFSRQSITVGNQWHECEAVGHVGPTGRKQGESEHWHSVCSLLCIHQPVAWSHPQLGVPSHLNPVQKFPHRHAQKSVSLVTLDPVELTIAPPSQRACEFYFFF